MTTSPATGGASGTQDVVDVLVTDHREMISLVDEIRSTTSTEEQRDLADRLIAELVRHSVAEEMYVYPVMAKHLTDGEAAMQHDKEEHKDLEVKLKELEGVGPEDARFLALVDEIGDALRHHVQDEEGEQFPQLRERVSREDLVDLAGKVETAKKLAPTRPHPAAPNQALFHKTLGPGAGLVDRLRDALAGRPHG